MDEYDEVMLVETPKSDPETHQGLSTLSPIISQDQILRFFIISNDLARRYGPRRTMAFFFMPNCTSLRQNT